MTGCFFDGSVDVCLSHEYHGHIMLASKKARRARRPDMCLDTCFASPDNHACRALSPGAGLWPNRNPTYACTGTSEMSRVCQHASLILHKMTSQSLEVNQVIMSRFFHVSREKLHCHSNVISVLRDISPLHHQTAMQSRLCRREILRALHSCCLFLNSSHTWRLGAFSTS